MIKQDDRTPEQVETMPIAVVGTDKFMSGWGGAAGGASVAAWACRPEHEKAVVEWVEARKDMSRLRTVTLKGYRPRCAHFHVYPVGDNHPALESLRRTGQL